MTPRLSLSAIARTLGGEACGQQVLCPGPGHSAKDRSLSIGLSATTPDGFVCHSFAGDDFRICRDFVRERLGLPTAASRAEPTPRATPARETRAEASAARRGAFMRAQIVSIISGLVPIRGTDGERYLRETRGIDTDAIADLIERTNGVGWHPKVYFHEPVRPGRPGHPLHGQLLGCIIGIMTDPVTALPTGAISRTYLHDGKKVGKAKSLGEGDGVVRISPDDEVTQGVHLAEGLESALSAAVLGFRPIWSTGSMSILAKFPVLSGIEALTVFADNDANGAGERAADEVALRWLQAGRKARVIAWDGIGDINDALKRGRRDEP
jgi:putative DNA primase/helicase